MAFPLTFAFKHNPVYNIIFTRNLYSSLNLGFDCYGVLKFKMGKYVNGRWVFLFLILLALILSLFFRWIVINSNGQAIQKVTFPKHLLIKNPLEEDLYYGKIHYKLRCSKCHGMQGQGGRLAPSLVDYNGNKRQLYKIIYEGIPGSNMKGWGKKMRPKDIVSIVHYVQSLNKHLLNEEKTH